MPCSPLPLSAVALFAATAAPAGGWVTAGLMFVGGAVVLVLAVAAAVHGDRAPAAVTAILADAAQVESDAAQVESDAAPSTGERTVVPFDAAAAGPVVGTFDVVVDGAHGPVVVTVDVSDTHLVAFRFR